MMAPTERNIKTRVMPHVISALDFPNCLAWRSELELMVISAGKGRVADQVWH